MIIADPAARPGVLVAPEEGNLAARVSRVRSKKSKTETMAIPAVSTNPRLDRIRTFANTSANAAMATSPAAPRPLSTPVGRNLGRVPTNPIVALPRMSCMNSPSAGPPGRQPVDPGRAKGHAAGGHGAEEHAAEGHGQDLPGLLAKVARGDHAAFESVYDQLAAPVYGVARKVLRDPAQSEEVAQEVMLEVWRSASRFDSSRGSAVAWVMTIAHRRAVDRVRSENASAAREQKQAVDQVSAEDVFELVDSALDRQRVRRCLGSLTTLQAEAIQLAYYQGYTYPQVAGVLGVALGTVKTRIRDGLIRMRDCLGVTV